MQAIEQVIRGLMAIQVRTRLELLLGGLVAAADELRMGEAELVRLLKIAIAQRAKALEALRKGGPVLFAPNGAPIVPTICERHLKTTPCLDCELRAAGRPDDSACRCKVWPCGCACHQAPGTVLPPHEAGLEPGPMASTGPANAPQEGDSVAVDPYQRAYRNSLCCDQCGSVNGCSCSS